MTGADLSDPAVVREGASRTQAISSIPGVAKVESPLLAPTGLDDPAVAPLVGVGGPASGKFATVVEFDEALDKAVEELVTEAAKAKG